MRNLDQPPPVLHAAAAPPVASALASFCLSAAAMPPPSWLIPQLCHDGFMGENHTVSFMGQKYDFFLENDVFVLLVLYFQTSSVFWQYWAMEADV